MKITLRNVKGAFAMSQNTIPLLSAFRDAFEKKDARKHFDIRTKGGERVITNRGSGARHGVSEAEIKKNLSMDLVTLSNTIDLESAIDLGDCEYVRKSILNYGLHDVTHLTSDEKAVEEIVDIIRDSLLAHEPRISKDALEIQKTEDFDEVNQRVHFEISSEIESKPYNIPIEFVAEVEVASGKLQLKKLPGTS